MHSANAGCRVHLDVESREQADRRLPRFHDCAEASLSRGARRSAALLHFSSPHRSPLQERRRRRRTAPCAVCGWRGAALRIDIGRGEVAVRAYLSSVVKDAAARQPALRPARIASGARTQARTASDPRPTAPGPGSHHRPQSRLRVHADHLHAFHSPSRVHRVPMHRQLQPKPHTGFSIEFVLQQVSDIFASPVYPRRASQTVGPGFRIRPTPKPALLDWPDHSAPHRFDCRGADPLILPRALRQPVL